MEFYHHLTVSVLAGLSFLIFFTPEGGNALALVSIAAVSGTLIDWDHAPVSRIVHGDWEWISSFMKNPLKALRDADSAVGHRKFTYWYRYVSHGLQVSAVAGLTYFIGGTVLKVALVSMSLHLLSDIAYDIWEEER